MGTLRKRLANGPVMLLDGATGTELERRGVRTGLPLWSTHALMDAPEVLLGIHTRYRDAGADVLTANTFRTQGRTLKKAGLGDRAQSLTETAVSLARSASQGVGTREVFVLGSAPPLEDCYRPDLVPGEAQLRSEHREHASYLAGAGVDGILVETMNTIREARVALEAALEVGLPVLVSFVCDARARLLSGEPLAQAISVLAPLEPASLGVNCLPASAVAPCLPILSSSGVPFTIYANQGDPLDDGGWTFHESLEPEAYAAHGRSWTEAGARMIGGCCGTGPLHTRALAALLREQVR